MTNLVKEWLYGSTKSVEEEKNEMQIITERLDKLNKIITSSEEE